MWNNVINEFLMALSLYLYIVMFVFKTYKLILPQKQIPADQYLKNSFIESMFQIKRIKTTSTASHDYTVK